MSNSLARVRWPLNLALKQPLSSRRQPQFGTYQGMDQIRASAGYCAAGAGAGTSAQLRGTRSVDP